MEKGVSENCKVSKGIDSLLIIYSAFIIILIFFYIKKVNYSVRKTYVQIPKKYKNKQAKIISMTDV